MYYVVKNETVRYLHTNVHVHACGSLQKVHMCARINMAPINNFIIILFFIDTKYQLARRPMVHVCDDTHACMTSLSHHVFYCVFFQCFFFQCGGGHFVNLDHRKHKHDSDKKKFCI